MCCYGDHVIHWLIYGDYKSREISYECITLHCTVCVCHLSSFVLIEAT